MVLHEGRLVFSFMRNRDQYVLPGGGVEPNETLRACAERECLEELGLVVDARDPVGIVREYYDGILRYENVYVQAEWTGARLPVEHTPEEDIIGITERWIPIEEVRSILSRVAAHEMPTEDQPVYVKRAIANCHMRELLGISTVLHWPWERIALMRTCLGGISVKVEEHADSRFPEGNG